MRKILFLFIALLMGVGTEATVTQPTLTTDVDNPVYYKIKNFRSNKYATYAGPSTQLSQIAEANMYSLWYFVENGTGVSIVPAIDPTVKLASTTSATAEGSVWYLVENPHKAGYFCVSLTSGATANCWDDQGSSTKIGYWQPSGSDNEGTSWVIEPVETTLSEVIAYRREQILPTINALPEVLRPAAKMTALNNAATDGAFRAAVADFSANVKFKCRSNKYLVVGNTAGSFAASPSGYEEYIQLESVGDGSFYIKGYMSMKYMADVAVSKAIQTELEANTPYYIQTVGDYAVARPTKYADTGDPAGYHYIHNGGSGCVGWESSNSNCQFTIENVELPTGYCGVTYNVELNDVIVATSNVRQAVGGTSAVPSDLDRDYTTYAYNVATIPNATTATITATATVSGLPFTVSSDFEHATWYYMRGHASTDYYPNYYISTNGSNLVWASGKSNADAYRWAFIGNPINGFEVINRAAGSGKYLQATDTKTTMGTTATGWIVKNQTNYGKPSSFGLWNNERTYANCAGGTVKYWGSFDQGSTFWLEEISVDEIEFADVIVELNARSWGTALGQYQFTGDLIDDRGNEATMIAALESAGYNAENLTAVKAMLSNNALNMPVTNTFLRVRSPLSDKAYLKAADASTRMTFTTTADKETIFLYASDGKLISYSKGFAVNNVREMGAVGGAGNTFVVITAVGGNIGQYSVKCNDGGTYNNNYLYSSGGNGSNADRNTLAAKWYDNNSFTLEKVTSLPITLNDGGDGYYYATLYLPVDATITGTDLEVFTVSVVGDMMSCTAVEGGKIKANTGVILKATAESATATLDDVTGTTTSALTGTFAAIPTPAGGCYVFGKKSEIGFYQWGSSETKTLAGFKAYYVDPGSGGSNGFVLSFTDDDPTAIAKIVNGQPTKSVFYDLQGRKVLNPVKGQLYIKNGKTILY